MPKGQTGKKGNKSWTDSRSEENEIINKSIKSSTSIYYDSV